MGDWCSSGDLKWPKKVDFFGFKKTNIGTHFVQMKTQINKLLSSTFSHLDILFVAKPMRILSNFFKFKYSIPKGLTSEVVYKFKCQGCGALYVGETVPIHVPHGYYTSFFENPEKIDLFRPF